ncbi:MAG TPA: hypothetical protein VE997_07735 [Candidatus Limnocylindria bacterium]|nr:hypothetical protein [Candidatus Limnocylindria bacterium]
MRSAAARKHALMEQNLFTLGPPAPNAPSGYALPDLADLVAELGASYPLLGYAVQEDEEYDEETALDPVIFAGLLHP